MTDPFLDEPLTAEEYFEYAVGEEVRRLRVAKTARERLALEDRPSDEPFDAGSLREILSRPPEPPYRVDRLIPADASTLLAAQRKTGKTTCCVNLADSLITGRPFLGEFDVRPLDGDVGFLNFEVSGAQIARWAADHGVDQDRMHLVNLRGRRNPLAHEEDRARLAALLRARSVEALFVDPFGRAYSGASQNDSGEVGAWLVKLDTFARTEVGAKDLILTAHAGWNGERTRGSSALEDWPDSIITMTRDEEDDGGRYIRAIGRDVDVDEDALSFDPLTRRLTLAGTGSRKSGRDARALSAMKTAILAFVQDHPGCSGQEIRDGVPGDNTVKTRARQGLISDCTLLEEKRPGRGGGMAYTARVVAGAA